MEEYRETLREYKKPIVTGFLTIGFGSVIYSIRKNTRGTNDFGYAKLTKTPGIQGSVNAAKYSAWIWATRAFALSTAIVGLTTVVIGYGISEYYEIDSLQSFNTRLSCWFQSTFPKMVIKNSDADDVALTEFIAEWDKMSKNDYYEENSINAYMREQVKQIFRR